MVLLTLLSIVQALALELLWSHVRESGYLLNLSMASAIAWIQITSTFLGLVLIWVVYAANAMRFRWVPATSDSVYPFLIGIIEFMLVEALEPGRIGLWLVLMAVIFSMMVWVSHQIMRRARLDGDNDTYFRKMAPATLRDFAPHIAIVCGLGLAGMYLLASGEQSMMALLAALTTAVVLCWQFWSTAHFWKRSVTED